MQRNFLFTSESVSEGHPDKIADQVSDAILDAIIKEDTSSRVACETLVKTGVVMIAGEVNTSFQPNFPKIVRKTIKEIGYTSSEMGFDSETCAVLTAIEKQSSNITQGVDKKDTIGAGDQGMMFGYACNETQELMPAPIIYAHKLVKKLADLRHAENDIDFLRPDSKSQVTFKYENGIPKYIDTIVISTQHVPDITQKKLKDFIRTNLINETVLDEFYNKDITLHVNPTGIFVIGGPMGDAGLTGRKIIVDTYGGRGRHGGGAFSGKDPTKVDRSAAYFARYIAKNIVASQLATHCEVQLAYAIGVPEPVSIMVDTFGTNATDEQKIEEAITHIFPATPKSIIEKLDLLKPIFKNTATYGHFGRNEFSWEKTDATDRLIEFTR